MKRAVNFRYQSKLYDHEKDMLDKNFVKGSIVKEKENNVEYKGIYTQDPFSKEGQESIKSTILDKYLKKYVVAFLNASEEGRLFLGISDKRKVEGVYLTDDSYDVVLSRFSQKIQEIDPPKVPESCCKITAHPLLDESLNEVANFYILEIKISKISKKKNLFRTSREGKYYFRNGASTEELKGTRLTEEIEYRHTQILLEDLEKINLELKQKPRNLKLREKKADILRYLGRTDEYLQIYEQLYNEQPNNSKIRKEYASSLEEKEKLEDALDVLGFDKPSLDDLKDPQWCTSVGILLRKEKRYRESIHFFDQALKNNRKYRKAYYEKKTAFRLLYTLKHFN